MSTPENPNKRRNLLRWQENRLRRLDGKIDRRWAECQTFETENQMSPTKLLSELRETAPSVAFTTSRAIDPYFSWDGDGPDPREDGFSCYNVCVSASVILEGEIVSEEAMMGGHYDEPGNFDPDLGGYLPQMLMEAADLLLARVADRPVASELRAASEMIGAEMRERYAEQMKG